MLIAMWMHRICILQRGGQKYRREPITMACPGLRLIPKYALGAICAGNTAALVPFWSMKLTGWTLLPVRAAVCARLSVPMRPL